VSAQVLCIASAKGGAGKTVTAAAMASFLAGLQRSVLLVDADAATNGLTLLYLRQVVEWRDSLARQNITPQGLFETGDVGSMKVLSLESHVDFLPAAYVMRQTEERDVEVFARVLADLIHISQMAYDFIIIDAQAGSDRFAERVIAVAHATILMSEYDPVSAEGIDRLRSLFAQHLTWDRTWVLFNKVLPEFAGSVGDALGITRTLPPIAWDADVVRALAARRLAIDYDHPNAYTLSIATVLKLVCGAEVENAVAEWLSQHQEAPREPLRERLQQIEAEIRVLDDRADEMGHRFLYTQRVRLRLRLVVLGVVSIATLAAGVVGLLLQDRAAYALAVPALVLGAVLGAYRRLLPDEEGPYLRAEQETLRMRLAELEALRLKYFTASIHEESHGGGARRDRV
jgi:cellulose biosynthesis protein BcsQ